MLFGPVLPVELVTSSRRTRYFIVRVVYALILLITLWTQYKSSMSWRVLGSSAITPSVITQFAEEFFESFAVVQVLAVLLLTPALVGGSIAEEKERRTLEYLFATDLRDWEIVLGKLTARMLHLLVLIAVGWPILALLMLLGGVSMESVLAAFAITASTALCVGALSMWCSVQARRARDAVMRVFVIGLALLLLPPLMHMFPWFSRPTGTFTELLLAEFLAADPFVSLNSAITQSGTHWEPIIQLVRNQAVLVVPCCVLAWCNVRRVYWNEAAGSTAKRGWRRIRLWRPPLGELPIHWKELFAERPALSLGLVGLIAQALLFLAAIVPGIWIFISSVRDSGRFIFVDELYWYVVAVGTAVSCVGLVVVAVHAAGSITVERERQTWDVLLSTPIEPWQIIHGKLAGSLYAMRGLLLVQLVLWGLGVLGNSISWLIVPLLLGEILLFALFVALVGMLFSMRLRTSLRSMAATVATTVFVGGAYLMCCLPALSGSGDEEILLAGCIPFLLALPTSWHWEHVEGLSYSIGLTFYCLACACLYGALRTNFDELSGRTSRSFRLQDPYRRGSLKDSAR